MTTSISNSDTTNNYFPNNIDEKYGRIVVTKEKYDRWMSNMNNNETETSWIYNFYKKRQKLYRDHRYRLYTKYWHLETFGFRRHYLVYRTD